MKTEKWMAVALVALLVIAVAALAITWEYDDGEFICEHEWTAGVSQDYTRKMLDNGSIPPVYYYTCRVCEEEIGSAYELDIGESKGTGAPLVISEDSGYDPNSLLWITTIVEPAWSIYSCSDIMFGHGKTSVLFEWKDEYLDIIYDANNLTAAAESFLIGMEPYLNEYIKDAAEKLTGVKECPDTQKEKKKKKHRKKGKK